jgi:hypothetical protein
MEKKSRQKTNLKPVSFSKSQIAPCGMNCGTCIAYLREKNRCAGCRAMSSDEVKTRLKCLIKNCEKLGDSPSGFCYDCENFPCKRIKNIDKRYRTKYHTSFLENLQMIEERGIDVFLAFETMRRTCPKCESVLSVHRDHCLSCNEPVKYENA